jgi:Protein of unknown function (DUF2971)
MSILDKILSHQIVPPVLYHYTSPKCFTEIVESGCLFAVSIRHINNDISFSHTITLVKEELQKQIKRQKLLLKKEGQKDTIWKNIKLLSELMKRMASLEQFHIFIVSFSQNGDATTSWQDYCPEGIGFSIGFNTQHLRDLAKRQGFILIGCCHNKTDQEKIVKALVEESVEKIKTDSKNNSEWFLTLTNTADEFAAKIIQLASICKHPHCTETSEWRLFAMPTPILPTNSSMQFMEKKSMPAPYLKFMLPDEKEIAPLLHKVIIGPTPDKKLSRDSLELFLSTRGLQSCAIHHSQIPYSGPL